jgi:hypothetical protein
MFETNSLTSLRRRVSGKNAAGRDNEPFPAQSRLDVLILLFSDALFETSNAFSGAV